MPQRQSNADSHAGTAGSAKPQPQVLQALIKAMLGRFQTDNPVNANRPCS